MYVFKKTSMCQKNDKYGTDITFMAPIIRNYF